MSLSVTFSRAHLGMEAPLVTIEVHISSGLPAFNIVGLPEAAVREAKDRVRSAIITANLNSRKVESQSTWHPLICPNKVASST